MNDSINALVERIAAFRDERDWKQFHNPKDLAISISLEAAELLEVFQWSGTDLDASNEKKMKKIREELADVLIYSCLMADRLNLNVEEIVLNKLEENNRKYPAEKAFGRADKYTAYVNDGGTEE